MLHAHIAVSVWGDDRKHTLQGYQDNVTYWSYGTAGSKIHNDMFTPTRRWGSVMVNCGFLVCLASSIIQPDQSDSCREISKVLKEKFQKHAEPTDVQNLYTCKNGTTCCNTISEYFFQHNAQQHFTKFALYTVNSRLNDFTESVYTPQINWETFNSLIEQVESGLNITYEHFFEIALKAIIPIKDKCLNRKEVQKLKIDAMGDIITLVNNIYAYQQGVEAINVTLQATATLQPSTTCATNISKAGIPLDAKFKPSGCTLCLDSTASAMVCRDLCLNVVRGCYASILKYKDLYYRLIKTMDEIYFNLNYHLEIQNGSLYSFIAKIENNLKNPEFAHHCSSGFRAGGGISRRRRNYDNMGPDLTNFEEFFTRKLGLESAIVDPGTLPCAVANNTPPCWNGEEIGNYRHMAYSYTLNEQEINPEGADLQLNEFQVSAVHMMQRALQLCNRTSSGERLFVVFKSDIDGFEEGYHIATNSDHSVQPTKSSFMSNNDQITENTSYKPPPTYINNIVESSTPPYMVNHQDNEPFEVRQPSTPNNSSSLTICQFSVTMVILYFVFVMR